MNYKHTKAEARMLTEFLKLLLFSFISLFLWKKSLIPPFYSFPTLFFLIVKVMLIAIDFSNFKEVLRCFLVLHFL